MPSVGPFPINALAMGPFIFDPPDVNALGVVDVAGNAVNGDFSNDGGGYEALGRFVITSIDGAGKWQIVDTNAIPNATVMANGPSLTLPPNGAYTDAGNDYACSATIVSLGNGVFNPTAWAATDPLDSDNPIPNPGNFTFPAKAFTFQIGVGIVPFIAASPLQAMADAFGDIGTIGGLSQVFTSGMFASYASEDYKQAQGLNLFSKSMDPAHGGLGFLPKSGYISPDYQIGAGQAATYGHDCFLYDYTATALIWKASGDNGSGGHCTFTINTLLSFSAIGGTHGIKSGTLASPPASLVVGEAWLDTTGGGTVHPILRVKVS